MLKKSKTNGNNGNFQKASNNVAKVPLKAEPDSNGDQTKSVIIGMATKKDENVCQKVRQLVSDWNDKNIHPEFVQNVNRDKTFNRKNGKAFLHVEAISPEANKALINGAKQYLKGNNDIKWYYNGPKDTTVPKAVELPPLAIAKGSITEQCRSVVKGLFTTKQQNALKTVHKIVKNWNDPEVKPEFISSVLRDKRCVGKNGKVLLFVTATSPQTCKALVTGGQKHLKDGVQWLFYERKKRSQSEGTENSDLDSNFADFEFIIMAGRLKRSEQ